MSCVSPGTLQLADKSIAAETKYYRNEMLNAFNELALYVLVIWWM